MIAPTHSLEEIEFDSTVQEMLKRRNLSRGSQKTYFKGIRFFADHYGEMPSELIPRFREMGEDEIVEEFANFFAARACT
jgi:hypothetical protein